MRLVAGLAGLLGGMALAGTVWAEPEPFTIEKKTVTLPEAELRSGPSTNAQFYPTNTLRKGDVIEVIKNKKAPAGWLAVKPPAGSFSWINAKFVTKENEHTATVAKEDADVLIGSPLKDGPPTARATPLTRGTLLTIVGKPLRASDGSEWLPVQPHATEIRYVSVDAVKEGAAPAAAAAPVATVAAKAQPEVLKDLYDRALRAEQERNLAAAQNLWYQLASQVKDPVLQNRYRDRALELSRSGGAPAALTGRIVPNQGTPATSLYGSPQWGPPGAAAAARTPGAAEWKGPGILFTTGITVDGKPVYRLESRQRETLAYVAAQPGFSLEQYVNRNVSVYGPLSWRGQERITLLTANYVTPAQQ